MIKSIILAAGKGTRMKSETPKVLHTIFDKTLVGYVIEAVNKTNNDHQTIRDLGESIKTTIKEVYNMIEANNELIGEHLDSIPEIKNLYADILLSRDTVDWIEQMLILQRML